MWDFTLHLSGNWALIDIQITGGAPFYLTFLVCFCHKFRINRFNLPLSHAHLLVGHHQLIILFQCQNVAAKKVRRLLNPFLFLLS